MSICNYNYDNYDEISNPAHYTDGRKYEPRKVIEDWDLNFNLGNVVKYVSRAGRKDGCNVLQDLKKARQYLDFEIERCSKPVYHDHLKDDGKWECMKKIEGLEKNYEILHKNLINILPPINASYCK